MKLDTWYKASDLVEVLGVKETRTKELLRALVADGKTYCNEGKVFIERKEKRLEVYRKKRE